MSTAIAPLQEMPREQIELVKRTVAKGATDDELALFLYQAKRTGLDPLSRQIHFIKRWDANLGRDVGTVQTGIDGLRLIANRTGRYRPDDKAARFTFDPEGPQRAGGLVSAKVRVYIRHDHDWFSVEAAAYYDEYVQTRKDGTPTALWRRMPRLMLAKCAEALALRKAFPAELSGIYAAEEFGETSTVSEPASVNTETGETTESAGEAPAGSAREAGTVSAHVDPARTLPQESPPELRKGAMGRLNRAFVRSGLSKDDLRDKARQMFGRESIASVNDLDDAELASLADEVEMLVTSTTGAAS